MPKININGITREMTEEEIAEMERRNAELQQSQPSLEDQIAELQEALDLLLSGVTE
jgi:cell division protein FtsB